MLPTLWALFVSLLFLDGNRKKEKKFDQALPATRSGAAPASARAKAGPFFLGLSLPTTSWCSLLPHGGKQRDSEWSSGPSWLSGHVVYFKVEVTEKLL